MNDFLLSLTTTIPGTDEQVKKMQYPGDPYLKQFGFEVDTSMVQVKGKVIQPPKLGYANNQVATAQGGVWDNRGKQFFKPMNVKNWAMLMFPPQNRCQSGDVKVRTRYLSLVVNYIGLIVNHNTELVEFAWLTVLPCITNVL